MSSRALIIAAGRGSRLAALTASKPLLSLGENTLIETVISSARQAGIEGFLVVTGYNRELLIGRLERFKREAGISVGFIDNPDWEMANGVSVLRAQGRIAPPFFLLMCDHLFDPSILTEMALLDPGDGIILAVDRRTAANPLVNLEDVTRVREEEGRILEIGKLLPRYNAFDTGIFLCGAGLFEALESARSTGKDSLSDGVRVLAERGAALTFDIGDRFWLDVDDERACATARSILESGE